MLQPVLRKNDKKATLLIYSFSVIVLILIGILGRIQLHAELPFDVHIFAAANAIINSIVTVMLVVALFAAKNKKFALHKYTMVIAMALSILFLLSYVTHHLLAGDTKFGGEGAIRYFYFFILISHIVLAAVILPFILFTAYRALIGEYTQHKKLARITWPIWFYVSLTGPVIYFMISPYY